MAGVVYASLVTFAHTHGGLATGSWYALPVLPALIAVLLGGLERGGRAGAVLAGGLVALGAYLLAATYFAKLLPLYGGYEGSARLGPLLDWYVRNGRTGEILSTTAFAPATALWALAAAVAALAIALAAKIGSDLLFRSRSWAERGTPFVRR
jgi:hypothetical protein